jgi:ubiquinone/menaquinone biosynthesis C-methylase UbiE
MKGMKVLRGRHLLHDLHVCFDLMLRRSQGATRDGCDGWDDYAPYYDWENARTIGRRDLGFWRRVVAKASGPVLELGCGSGRVLIPIARTKTLQIGIDRSAPMLAIARRRAQRVSARRRPMLTRGDIRAIPLATESIAMVIAPYGILQSLIRKHDLNRTLREVARVLRPGGAFVADLVPDLPKWKPYQRQVRLHGRRKAGERVTLVESVRQNRRRGLTIFEEEFLEHAPSRGRATSRSATVTARFSLTFRTLSMTESRRRFDRAGFRVERILGGYRGQPWTPTSDTWLIVARKR